jgi:hypothetical protein
MDPPRFPPRSKPKRLTPVTHSLACPRRRRALAVRRLTARLARPTAPSRPCALASASGRLCTGTRPAESPPPPGRYGERATNRFVSSVRWGPV